MALRTLKAENFKGLTDLPLYNRGPEWLKVCQNFRVMPSGYLEARMGFEKLKPSGGTAADPISAGIYTGGHEHTMADGFIFTAGTGGTVFSANLAQRGYYEIFSDSAEAQHDAIYIGSTLGKFSRVVFYIGQAMVAVNGTVAYEYPKSAAWDTDGNAATSGTFTLTTTPTFTATGSQVLEVQDPGSAWVPAVRNGVYAYWIRIRLTNATPTITTALRQGPTSSTDTSAHKAYADWPGARQIYVASAASASGAGNGALKYYGQTSGTAVAWQSVSTSLFSGNYPRSRFASYRNLLYFVNGKEQKRWDGNTLADLGFTAPTNNGTAGVADSGGGSGLDGVFGYAITYGYGPLGEWGESSELDLGSVTLTTNDVTVTLDVVPGTPVECIYIYRTTDLTSVPTSATSSFPMFRIATVYRGATGSFPATYTDQTAAFPFPPVELNIATRTPPSRCKFVAVHKNRLFLASNNQYPGRVWWSEPFEAEAFLTDENFADFTRSTGGQLTGIVEFGDQIVAFTEDKMFGIANVDQDQPSIFEIAVVGCVAPDSIATADGNLMWLGRNGVYRWTGEGLPERVSNDTSTAFGKMSIESHGGSRAAIHNRLYEVYCITNANTEAAFSRYRYDLVTNTWATMSIGLTGKIAPLAVVTAPLGHADAGVRHPLYGQADTSGTNYAIYIGEYTESDDGSSFTCRADVHYGPPMYASIRPDAAYAVYDLPSANWESPALAFGTAAVQGTLPVLASTGTVDGATDYNKIAYRWTTPGEAFNDCVMSFTVASDTGTSAIAAGSQGRLLALYLSADVLEDTAY